MEHPYRSARRVCRAEPRVGPIHGSPAARDGFDILATLSVVWLPSLARLVLALHRSEPCAFEPVLALAITLVTPVVLGGAWRQGRRRP
jgi:hypothetical protein